MEDKTHINGLNRELLVRYLCKEVNDHEKSVVENWLSASPDNRGELEQSRKLLQKTDLLYGAESFPAHTAWNQVRSKITTPEFQLIQHKTIRKEAFTTFYKYAAILVITLLVATVGYYLGFINQTHEIYSEVISAEKQVVNEYLLPDGSAVTLNSSSKLIFPKQFSDNRREVTVEGEAFFDVKPKPEKPFVINAGNAQIRVLGTSFTVSADPKSDNVEVIVATGKVQVSAKNNKEIMATGSEVFLLPGEKVILFGKENRFEKSTNSDRNYLAWKTQDLIFDEVPLSDVIECLEKVYHVDIQLADPSNSNLLLKAHFDKKPIDFVLNVIRLTFNLDLLAENEHFVLTSRKTEQVKP